MGWLVLLSPWGLATPLTGQPGWKVSQGLRWWVLSHNAAINCILPFCSEHCLPLPWRLRRPSCRHCRCRAKRRVARCLAPWAAACPRMERMPQSRPPSLARRTAEGSRVLAELDISSVGVGQGSGRVARWRTRRLP
jgi:hypothetical protein